MERREERNGITKWWKLWERGNGETKKPRKRKKGDEEMVTGKMGKWKNPEVGWIHGEMGNFCYEWMGEMSSRIIGWEQQDGNRD